LIKIKLVAGNDGREEATKANLSIVEIKTEKSLGKADALRGCNHITEVFKQIEGVIKLFLA
jgi:hypothetical protein